MTPPHRALGDAWIAQEEAEHVVCQIGSAGAGALLVQGARVAGADTEDALTLAGSTVARHVVARRLTNRCS